MVGAAYLPRGTHRQHTYLSIQFVYVAHSCADTVCEHSEPDKRFFRSTRPLKGTGWPNQGEGLVTVAGHRDAKAPASRGWTSSRTEIVQQGTSGLDFALSGEQPVQTAQS